MKLNMHTSLIGILICAWVAVYSGVRATARSAPMAVTTGMAATGATAAENASSEQVLRFRRIYVPEGRSDLLTVPGVRMVPMKREAFERIMRSAGPDPSAAGAAPSIVEAVYRAKLEPATGMLHGTAQWRVRATDGKPEMLRLDPCRMAIRRLLRTSDTSAATGMPAATEIEADAATDGDHLPSELRVLPGIDRSGRVGVIVDGPCTLAASWTLRSDTGAADATAVGGRKPFRFAWDVPPSLTGELILELPDGMVPELDGAVISRLPGFVTETMTESWSAEPATGTITGTPAGTAGGAATGGAATSGNPAGDAAATPRRRAWKILFPNRPETAGTGAATAAETGAAAAGGAAAVLRIFPGDPDTTILPETIAPGVRQSLICTALRHHLEITATFVPQPGFQLPSTMELQFTCGGQILDVRLNDVVVPYEIVTDGTTAGNGDGGGEAAERFDRIRLFLPTPASVPTLPTGGGEPEYSEELTLTALYPIPETTPDDAAGDGTVSGEAVAGQRPAPVGIPRFLPDGALQELTTVVLIVPEAHVPEELIVTDGRQVFSGPIWSTVSGRSYGFQLFSSRGRVRFRPGNPGVPFFASSGTTVSFDGLSIRTLTVAECRVSEGERFDLRLPLADGWKIESVTAEDPGVLRDWSVFTRVPGAEPDDDGGRRSTGLVTGSERLLIQLRRPLTPEMPVVLQIAARGPEAPIGSRRRGGELLPFLFPASEADTWIAFRQSPFCLWRSLETTPLPRTPWGRVRESLRRLFPQSVRSIQAWTDIMDHPFILEEPEEDYSVEQKVTAEFGAAAIRETTELAMNVRSPGIDRVRIHYREPRTTPPLWTMILVPVEGPPGETGLPETGAPAAGAADGGFTSGVGAEATFLEPPMTGNGTGGARQRGVIVEPVEVVPIPTEMRMAEATAADGVTTWELRFGRPVENAFTLCEQRVRTLDSPLEMSVVSVPGANRQSGLLVVCKSPEAGVRNHQLEAVSGDPEEMRFAFDPDLIAASPDAVFEFLPPAHFPEATAVRVWESTLLSTMIGGGEFRSRVVWKLENEGVDRLPIRLPAGWDVDRIEELRLYDRNSGRNSDLVADCVTDWLVDASGTNGNPDGNGNGNTNGTNGGTNGGVDGGKTIFVRLPVDRRYVTLSMAWRTPTSGSSRQFRLTPEIPRPLVPVLHRTQQLALPPEYRLIDVTGEGFATSTFRRTSPMERFFGVLARPANEPVFSPGTAEGGTQRTWFHSTARESATGDALLATLTEVAETMTPATDAAPGTTAGPAWGELLRATAERLTRDATDDTANDATKTAGGDSVPVILVDRIATGKAGISPDSVVRFPENRDALRSSPDSASRRGMLLLENSGLTLLVHGRTALITTRSRAAFHRRELVAIDGGWAWAVLPGALGDRLRDDATHRDAEFIPPATWRNLPALAAGPWSLWSPSPTPFPMTADPMFQAERTDDRPLTFVVADRFFRSGLEAAAMLMALGAVLSLPKAMAAMRGSERVMRRVPAPLRGVFNLSRVRPRVRLAIGLLGMAALMAAMMTIPETMIGFGRGIFWGTCAGISVIVGRRRIQEAATGGPATARNPRLPRPRAGGGRRSGRTLSPTSPSTEPFIPAPAAVPESDSAFPAGTPADGGPVGGAASDDAISDDAPSGGGPSTVRRTPIRAMLPWLMLAVGLLAATRDVSIAQEETPPAAVVRADTSETPPAKSPEPAPAPTAEPVAEPENEPTVEPTVEPVAEPVADPATDAAGAVRSADFFPDRDPEPLEMSIPTTRLSPEVGRLLMGVSMPREIPVLIPIDPKTLRPGEQVYVPLDFHGVLSRQAEASERIIDGWQLLSASYQMQLRTDRAEWLCRAESFRCVFEFEVVEPDSLIRIPLGSRQWVPRMNELVMDGRRTAGSWLVSESVLLIPVAQTGRVVLEVPMQVTPRRENGRLVCEGRIPPLPEATFDLEIADERGVHFRVDSALGPDLPDGRSRRRWFPGATDRLVWSWSESVSTLETVNTTAELDETTLLRFTQDGVALDVNWKFRNLTEPVNCFEVLCPPDMEMLPLGSDAARRSRGGDAGGGIVALRCGLETGTAERTQRGYLCRFAGRIGSGIPVETTFQARPAPMTGATGIGKRRIPELRIPAVHTTRRRMIPCTAPELELELRLPTTVAASGATGLTGVTGVAGVAGEPVTAMTLPLRSAAPPGELAKMKFHGAIDPDAVGGPLMATVRTSPARTQVGQQMICGFHRDRAQIELNSRIRILSGAVFQYVIDAPPELEIEEIRVTDEEVTIPSRWSRSVTGRITLFLDVPATSRQELRLLGWIPVKCPGDWTVPAIRVVGSTRLPDTLEIFRRESVRVGVRGLSGLEPTESTAVTGAPIPSSGISGASAATGRLVAAYREIVADAPAGSGEMSGSPGLSGFGDVSGIHGTGGIAGTAETGGTEGGVAAESAVPVSLTVSLEPNSPRIVGSTWAWLRPATAAEMAGSVGTAGGATPSGGEPAPSAWRMSLFVDLQVDAGVVDTFRIPLPTGWTEPFTCSRTMMLELSENSSTGARYLSVRPAQPTSGRVQFTVTGTLQGREIAALPRLPVIHLERGENVVEHAILPTRHEQREILWNVPSWADGELPGSVVQTLGIPANLLPTLRTVRIPETLSGSTWITASRRLMRRPPRLALAAISCSWFEDGSVLGRGQYLIEPGGRREAELTLPAGASLIAVTVGERIVQAENVQREPDGRNRIRFPFGPPDLPQQVTLLWKQSAVRRTGHSLTLLAPVWSDFQPQRTLWQVLSPPGWTVGTHTAAAIHPGEQPLIHLEQLTGMLEIGIDVLRDRPAEASRWIAQWSDHWERNRRWFLHNMAMETVSAPTRLRYDSLVQRHAAALAEFQERNGENAGFAGGGATVFPGTAIAGSAKPEELRVTPQLDSGERTSPLLCVLADGEMAKMTLDCEPRRPDPDGGATALLVVMTAMLLVAGWLLMRPDPPIRPVMKNEPIGSAYQVPGLLLLAGIFCGLWLQPGWIGAVFATLAVVLAVRIARRRSARRHEPHLPEAS